MNKQGLVYTVIFSFIVTFAFVFPLALANEATKPVVEANAELSRRAAVLAAFDVAYTDAAEVEGLYANVKTLEKDGQTVFAYTKDGKTAYAKQFAGPGLWGTIFGVLGVNEQFTETVGLQIISHSETPGLGGRIDEAWFKAQFRGEELKDGRLTVTTSAEAVGDNDKTNGVVDGITGASRTNQAIAVMINQTVADMKKLLGVR